MAISFGSSEVDVKTRIREDGRIGVYGESMLPNRVTEYAMFQPSGVHLMTIGPRTRAISNMIMHLESLFAKASFVDTRYHNVVKGTGKTSGFTHPYGKSPIVNGKLSKYAPINGVVSTSNWLHDNLVALSYQMILCSYEGAFCKMGMTDPIKGHQRDTVNRCLPFETMLANMIKGGTPYTISTHGYESHIQISRVFGAYATARKNGLTMNSIIKHGYITKSGKVNVRGYKYNTFKDAGTRESVIVWNALRKERARVAAGGMSNDHQDAMAMHWSKNRLMLADRLIEMQGDIKTGEAARRCDRYARSSLGNNSIKVDVFTLPASTIYSMVDRFDYQLYVRLKRLSSRYNTMQTTVVEVESLQHSQSPKEVVQCRQNSRILDREKFLASIMGKLRELNRDQESQQLVASVEHTTQEQQSRGEQQSPGQ
jgi:hypothetical protein